MVTGTAYNDIIGSLNKYKSESLVLFTRNAGKIHELKLLLEGTGFKAVSLNELDESITIPEVIEDGVTFAENALKKARTGAQATGKVVLADDSGLVVDYLNGAPGVYSARFAGLEHNDEANNQKLLQMLKGVPDSLRNAYFCCCIALVTPEGQEITVEGTCQGIILAEPRGNNGFGYDPLFFSPMFNKTFAQLNDSEKNLISHRGMALGQIRQILLSSMV